MSEVTKLQRRRKWVLGKYNCSLEFWESVSVPMRRAYAFQKHRAKRRGIGWEFGLEDWMQVWNESGKLAERGTGHDKYCMARNGDTGPYASWNVTIKTNSENSVEGNVNLPYKERFKNNPDRLGRSDRGMYVDPRCPERPWKMIFKGNYAGHFRTKQDAIEAKRKLLAADKFPGIDIDSSHMTPTQRSKKHLEDAGYKVAIVEKWNSHARIRQDLFGFIDLLGIREGETIAIQTTSYAHVSDRVRKITEHENVAAVRKAGWKIVVHGWRKKDNRWVCREVDLS